MREGRGGGDGGDWGGEVMWLKSGLFGFLWRPLSLHLSRGRERRTGKGERRGGDEGRKGEERREKVRKERRGGGESRNGEERR